MITIPPQATKVYNQLNGKAQTAKEIAKKLHVLPNAIYRSISVLEQFGFVKKVGKHPTRYQSQKPENPVELYLNAVKKDLLEHFPIGSQINVTDNHINMTFIKSRTEQIKKSDEDIKNAQKEVNLIISGHEVPAETVLEYKKAVDRGVKIRFIVQNMNEVKRERLKNWQRLGVEVRHYPLIEARIIVIDSKIFYITSYNPDDIEEGKGVRFDYAPIARIMQDLFQERWKQAKAIV